ncbi:hypothetical protein [Flexibacterium corallicola]|uniref:hypothetical protein n=1 Tax=Flexibacterium corallicola TaxID=3037259 RepID=UPI00286F5DFD|nr:hypothetical protein [Pseudovibrio sp. M1P-2-3]
MNSPKAKELHLKAKHDLREGKDELLKHLEQLPPQQLASIAPETLSRLTSADRQRLFAKAGLKQTQPLTPKRETKRQHLTQKRQFVRLWYRLPVLCRSLTLAGTSTVSIIAVAFGLLVVLPSIQAHIDTPTALPPTALPPNALRWKGWRTLSPAMDGCTYRVKHSLSWRTAARLLKMTEPDLRKSNSHLSNRPITLVAHDLLVVWRGRIPLEDR